MESVAITEHLIKLIPVAEPGLFDLVGYVISAMEGKPYQSLERHGRLDFQRLALVDHPAVRFLWLLFALFLSSDSFDNVYVCLCGPGGDYMEDGNRLYKDMNRLVAYYKGMTTWAR